MEALSVLALLAVQMDEPSVHFCTLCINLVILHSHKNNFVLSSFLQNKDQCVIYLFRIYSTLVLADHYIQMTF